jgi:hypothetical protein
MYQLNFDSEEGAFQIVDPILDQAPRLVHQLDDGVTLASTPSNPIRFFPRGHAQGGVILLRNTYGDGILLRVSASGMVDIGDYQSGEYHGYYEYDY